MANTNSRRVDTASRICFFVLVVLTALLGVLYLLK
jgi:hypothetical protein